MDAEEETMDAERSLEKAKGKRATRISCRKRTMTKAKAISL